MDNQPIHYKCPFRNPIITRDYLCECAQEVTFREGPGIACSNTESWERCTNLFEGLKSSALPVFEVADDLTTMPASVLSKIQYGGLAALAGLLKIQENAIENINTLMAVAMDKYGSVEQLDYESIIPVIKDYKLRKRRKG